MAERGRPKAPLVLTDDERQTLQRWSRRSKTAQALALRCKIVLACADGQTNQGRSPTSWGSGRRRSPNGVAGLCVNGWKG